MANVKMAPITYPEKSILIPLIKVYELLVETIQHFQHVKFLELKKEIKILLLVIFLMKKMKLISIVRT